MFFCKSCNYKTEIASNYKKHLKTNKHKRNNILNKNLESEIVNPSQNLTIPHNTSQYLTNPPAPSQNLTIPHNPSQYLTNQEMNYENYKQEYICEYCSKSFSRIDNLNRHIKKYCKKKIDVYEVINELKEERIAMKNERDLMMKIQKENLERIENEKANMKKQIEFLLDKVGDTTNITNNQNIVLNCYGNEDLSHITEQFKLGLLKLPYSMITNLIKEIHFNEKYPANNNICLPNKKEPFVKVYQGESWIYKDKKETIQELIQKNCDRLDEYYENKSDKMEKDAKKRYITFQEKINNDDKSLDKTINKNIEMILLNQNNY